jgi:DNA recombination protein RmuC
VNELASKGYAQRLDRSVEFVVLFIPGEVFFSAALRAAPELIEESANKGIILASPTTLLAMLKAVAYGWREQRLADNAQRISELGRELHERLARMVEHLGRLGQSLEKSVEAFNSTIGSFNSRVMPSVQRLSDLGAAGPREVAIVEEVDNRPRLVASRGGA